MDVVQALPDLWREWEVLRSAPPGATSPHPVRAAPASRPRSDRIDSVDASSPGGARRCCAWHLPPRLSRSPGTGAPRSERVIGDFSRVNAIAASLDRVYIVSPSAVLIWNPQFQRWEGSFDPPDSIAARAGSSPVSPIRWTTHSGWRVRTGGCTISPISSCGIRVWCLTGSSPSPSIRTIPPPVSISAPGAAGSCCLAAATVPVPAQAPGTPARAGLGRAGDSQQPLASGQRGRDSDRQPPAQRPLHRGRAGVRQPGLVSRHLRDRRAVRGGRCGAARAAQLRPAIGSGRCASSAGPAGSGPAPTGLRLRMPRSRLSPAILRNFDRSRVRRPLGTPFDQVRDLAGQGKAIWAATDLGVARVNPADGRIELVDDSRGLPDSRVYSIASRGGRITVGTERGIARISDSLDGGAVSAVLLRSRLRGLPGRRLGLGRNSVPACSWRCPGSGGPGAAGGPDLTQPTDSGRGPRYSGRHAGGPHPRRAPLARSADPPMDTGAEPLRAARPPASLRSRGPGLLGRGRSRRSASPG